MVFPRDQESCGKDSRVHWLIRSLPALCPPMWRIAALIVILLAIAPSGSTEFVVHGKAAAEPLAGVAQPVSVSLQTWRLLRQSDDYRFADYAAFVAANPDWPGSERFRRLAERAIEGDEDPSLVVAF